MNSIIRFIKDSRNKRLLIIGALLLLAGMGYRFSSGFEDSFDINEEIALKKVKIKKFGEKVALMDQIEKNLATSRKTINKAEMLLLSGDTEALAAVDIQNMLNEIARRSNVELKTTKILKSDKLAHEAYLGIRVEINFSATIRQIKEICYRIETSGKWLEIPSCYFDVPDPRNPEKINAKMVVGGMMKKAAV
jgi:hypothetical protein